ncbi:MAG: phosphoribosyltransferase [Pseudomonadota bacterium]|jgi:hypoxanthine phosphoribosyltransferase
MRVKETEMGDPLPQRCEIVSWHAVHAMARKLAHQVIDSGFRPEIIVAIGRGGLVPGRILSDLLGQMDLTSFKIEHYHHATKLRAARVRYPLAADVAGRRVLLVDDVADSGETFAIALEHLASHGAPAAVKSAVLHYKTVSPYRPDFYARQVRNWRWIIYPWAVAEDVGSCLRAMQPPPADAAQAAQRLAEAHGIRLPRNLLADLLAIIRAAP